MKWITEVMEEQANKRHKEFIKNLKLNKMNTIPRRNRIDLFTPAEKAIYEAIREVEKVGADTLLTEAVILLQQAMDKVSDFVDKPKMSLGKEDFDGKSTDELIDWIDDLHHSKNRMSKDSFEAKDKLATALTFLSDVQLGEYQTIIDSKSYSK